ncbi:MAG: putative major facilitator superfamily transporter [Herminiimonas sp.]|nr:putative major facilitator superfamily transporter [Herminiimonas sp.]MDB5853461.1 putative major facilitator superfamily transporter [Herminiimonas sp.]
MAERDLLVDAEANDHDELPVADSVGPGVGPTGSSVLAVLAICLAGANMRPAISSLAPVLGAVRQSTGMSSTMAGLLTTLPVLCFGLFAPLAPLLARRISPEKIITITLGTLAAGILLRAFFGIPGLFVGSLVAGACISVVMVLLPGIVKRDFPAQASRMTGLYTMSLCMGAAVAAGATVPIQTLAAGDWRVGLGFWLLPAVVAALMWRPLARRYARHAARAHYKVSGLGRSALAWQVTIYMGAQSALAYCVFGWLPTILIDRGMAPLQAGLVLSASILMQAVTGLGGPWLAMRGKDQSGAILILMVCVLAGLLGCIFAPLGSVWPWAILLGLGQGGSFSVALMLLVLRSSDAHVAASLSGMAQGVGYTLAAFGPLAVGLLHDATHDWKAVAIFCCVVTVIATVAGMLAGRSALVKATITRLS